MESSVVPPYTTRQAAGSAELSLDAIGSLVADGSMVDNQPIRYANRISLSKSDVAEKFKIANSQVVWLGGLPRYAAPPFSMCHTSREAPNAPQALTVSHSTT